eukprot:TRINITY_DN8803_c0_g1_i1.p1 TRINITY_DN8803_c0_g1~~TRINITY_DN8803_c0_g1_i1.p1  ORF type:complete len:258 (+),score=147.21 TRINITY_DN8803_c0_g1_i1:142-915(+)
MSSSSSSSASTVPYSPEVWDGVVIKDLEDNDVEMSTLWKDRKVVVIFVRRFGCALCHQQAHTLMELRPKLSALGYHFIAIGNGSKTFAKKFQTGLPFEGEIYIDSTSESFKKASLPRLSMWQITKRFLLNVKLFGVFYDLNKKFKASDAVGDGQQTGGVFVFGPGSKSEILYSFRENDNEPDVFVNPDEIWKACGGSGDWRSAPSVESPDAPTSSSSVDFASPVVEASSAASSGSSSSAESSPVKSSSIEPKAQEVL